MFIEGHRNFRRKRTNQREKKAQKSMETKIQIELGKLFITNSFGKYSFFKSKEGSEVSKYFCQKLLRFINFKRLILIWLYRKSF